MSFVEYKFPRCNRVHAAISRASAERIAVEQGDMAPLLRCFGCGASTADFVPASADDTLSDHNLAVVVVPGVWK